LDTIIENPDKDYSVELDTALREHIYEHLEESQFDIIDTLSGALMRYFSWENYLIDEIRVLSEQVRPIFETLWIKHFRNSMKKALKDIKNINSYDYDHAWNDWLFTSIHNSVIGKEKYYKLYFWNNAKNEIFSAIENYFESKTIKEYDKLKPWAPIEYSFSLSAKELDDVTFGNDGWCCLAVTKGHIWNATNLPYYLCDNATNIFNIQQKIGNRKEKRTWIVLTFDWITQDWEKILVCNSVELSKYTNPWKEIEWIVWYVEA